MKNKTLTVILFIGCIHTCVAQTEMVVKKEKSTDQYLGVQINGLIRQVFNFNNSTSSSDVNPYLLTYSINSRKTGWGLRAGIGYTYNLTSTSDGITNTDTKINDIHARVGVEKVFKLSDKWAAGAGLDVVYNTNDDHTTATVNASFNGFGTTTDTKTNIYSYGGGPEAWLRYHITDRVQVGTEVSFYYISGDQKQTIVINDPNNFNNFTPPTDTDNKLSQGVFNSPIVFFLTVKF